MSSAPAPAPNVQQVVPFFMVTDMSRSLRFYMEGLGFTMKYRWTPDSPDKIRWCWLELGGASVMLQEYNPGPIPTEELGKGASIWFQCQDSLSLSTTNSKPAASKPANPSSATTCGTSPSPTPTATASTSNPPRMSPKKPNSPKYRRAEHRIFFLSLSAPQEYIIRTLSTIGS